VKLINKIGLGIVLEFLIFELSQSILRQNEIKAISNLVVPVKTDSLSIIYLSFYKKKVSRNKLQVDEF